MTVVSTRRTRGVSRLDARTMASTAHNHPADAAGFEPASPLALQAVSLLLCAHRLASLTHARHRSAIACDSTNTGDIASNSNPGARARRTRHRRVHEPRTRTHPQRPQHARCPSASTDLARLRPRTQRQNLSAAGSGASGSRSSAGRQQSETRDAITRAHRHASLPARVVAGRSCPKHTAMMLQE
jgi:hypothetical protein